MAWIQVHQSLKDHKKLYEAADELQIPPAYMLGLLVAFWLWALDNAPDGRLDEIRPRTIARAAGWDGDADKFIAALKTARFVDDNGGALALHNWGEYTGKLLERREAERERSRKRREPGETVKPAVDQQTTAGRPPDIQRTTEIQAPDVAPETEEKPAEAPKENALERRFNSFWAAYPKKVAKATALKVWKRIRPDQALTDIMLAAIERQKRSEQWRKDNGQYIPNPTTWLNGGRWEDEEVKQGNAEYSGNNEHEKTADEWTKGFFTADDGE